MNNGNNTNIISTENMEKISYPSNVDNGEGNKDTNQKNYQFFDETKTIEKKTEEEDFMNSKVVGRRDILRKRKEKKKTDSYYQDSDNDDLDYVLEDDMVYDKRSKGSSNRNRYSKNYSNSRISRGSRSIISGEESKDNEENQFRIHRNDSNGNNLHCGWKPEEDARLREAIELYGTLDWMKISNFVGNGRTRSQCSQRWHRCLDPHISKEKWSMEEIELLQQLVAEYGDRSWARIASKMEKRCDVQCRYMYKRLVSKKTIRGIPNNSLQKSNGNSSDELDNHNNNFENEKNSNDNLNPYPQNIPSNTPHQNIFMINQKDFLLHQPQLNLPTNNYDSSSSFIQTNHMNNNNDYQSNMMKTNNMTETSIFPISESVFSLFDIPGVSRINLSSCGDMNSEKTNQQNGNIMNYPPPLQKHFDVKQAEITNIQISEPVIKTTPIDELMEGFPYSKI
ncbi:hypothetical protein M9Y10_042079 [Tritrichomonas musculus]|uniref:Myb-like DNA-binding domain containing protein n=1 Tax=Tritrichomonas musculus TaxID=1915356 RepID=A0ABR2K6C6_9EUKA